MGNWRIHRKWWHVYGGPIMLPDGSPGGYSQTMTAGVQDGPADRRSIQSGGDGRPVTSALCITVDGRNTETGEPMAVEVNLEYLASFAHEPPQDVLDAIVRYTAARLGLAVQADAGPDAVIHWEQGGELVP